MTNWVLVSFGSKARALTLDYLSPGECDLYDIFPVTDNTAPDPPMFVKFTYADEWWHIPADEMYPVWIKSDIARAAVGFQKRHDLRGKLVAFVTGNGGI